MKTNKILPEGVGSRGVTPCVFSFARAKENEQTLLKFKNTSLKNSVIKK